MPEVVLVNCRGRIVPERREHLGLGCLASYLRGEGIDTQIVDGHFDRLDARDIARRVSELRPTVVGFTIFFSNQAEALATARLVRGLPSVRHICLGGHHASFRPGSLLADPAVDAVVRGEGELTLTELVRRVRRKQEWRDTPGLAFRDDAGGVRHTGARALIPDLDALPFPDRSVYRRRLREEGVADVASSRGCYACCSFCSVSAFYRLGQGTGWRARSPRHIVDEMERLAEEGARHIHFVDDNFMGRGETGRERARAFGRELLRRKLELTFDLDCRPTDVHEETFAFLQTAGLRAVGTGIESMIPRQLKLYRKGTTVEQNLRAIATLERLGLDYRLYYIPLDPYATVEELIESLDWMERIGLSHFIEGQIPAWLVVLEGTTLIERLRREGVLWTRPDGSTEDFAWGQPYVVRDSRLGPLLPRLYELHHHYVGLREGPLEELATDNRLVQRFVQQTDEIIKRHKFDSVRLLLRGAKDGEAQKAWQGVQERLAELRHGIDRIRKAQRAGTFRRFATRSFRLGTETVSFPPRELAVLVEALAPTQTATKPPRKAAGLGRRGHGRVVKPSTQEAVVPPLVAGGC